MDRLAYGLCSMRPAIPMEKESALGERLVMSGPGYRWWRFTAINALIAVVISMIYGIPALILAGIAVIKHALAGEAVPSEDVALLAAGIVFALIVPWRLLAFRKWIAKKEEEYQ